MESTHQNKRRQFLTQGGKLATVLAAISATGGLAYAAPASTSSVDCKTADNSASAMTSINHPHYYLKNVRLEKGFVYEGSVVTATETDLATLEIKDGKIIQIHSSGSGLNNSLPAYDGMGKLLLPAFRDMHIHLDKTFYGGPWQAPRSRKGKTIMDMITLEQQLLPTLQPTTQERAGKLIDLLHSKGSVIARSHCNVDPVSGLKNLENLMVVLEQRKPEFSCEVVAFPQHGLLHSQSENLMREAMKMGAQYVGGLDPTNVDGAMEKSLDTMFQIALDSHKWVDIHLHETSPAGVAAVNYIIDTVAKNPSLKGNVTISHAFALSTLSPQQTEETATRLAEQQISIASSIPIGTLHMPLPQLTEKGVFVMTGTDSVIDHWSPFGSGDMLEKANLYAQLYTRPDEFTLSRSLAIATGNVLPLDSKGQQVWPKANDKADFVLVDASCSAEAVARVSGRQATFHQGRLVYGSVGKAV